MTKKVLMAVLAVLLTGVLAFCCGYPTTILSQLLIAIVTAVLLYGILTDVFITKWETIKNQPWYYWVMVAVAVVACIIALLSARLNSRLWIWIGFILLIADAVVYGLVTKAKN